MGAGLLYGGQMAAKELDPVESPETVAIPEQGETSHTLENGLKVAAVNDDLSFGEAFAQARAEVGPGGVFHWHGGIYNTYTAAEWNNMSVGEKHDFAQQVQPEVRPDEVPTPTDANSHVIVEHHVYHHHEGSPATQAEEVHQAAADASEVGSVSANTDAVTIDSISINAIIIENTLFIADSQNNLIHAHPKFLTQFVKAFLFLLFY